MAISFTHQYVTIKYEISSGEYVKPFQLRLPSTNDWTLNLQSISKRVPKKLNPLSDINQSHLILFIDNILINEKDPIQFGQLLSQTPPPAIITVKQASV